jgi:D-alanyl-D-alanine carboxypeptidase
VDNRATPRRRIRHLLAITAALAVVGISGCSNPAPQPTTSTSPSPTSEAGFDADTTAAMQAALDETRAEAGFPGVIARVITPGGTWTGTSGTAGPDTDAAPTATAHSRVGSITKTITGTVLLQLVDEGLISLDDPVSKYVPDAPNGTATIRQVADMTSGIPSYSTAQGWQAQFFGDPTYVFTPQELLDYAKGLPVSFAPGEGWEYSNTNYVIFGMIIEELTGQPIADLYEERIFGPLGMDSTSFPAGSAALPSPHLGGITEQGQPDGTTAVATDWSPSGAFTAGEVISTMDDLEKWGHALFTGEGILSPEMQQLRRDSILTSPPPNTATAGYGIAIGNRDGWWGHTGEIPGYNTTLYHNYEDETTIIVIVNSDVLLASGVAPAPATQAALQTALGLN